MLVLALLVLLTGTDQFNARPLWGEGVGINLDNLYEDYENYYADTTEDTGLFINKIMLCPVTCF